MRLDNSLTREVAADFIVTAVGDNSDGKIVTTVIGRGAKADTPVEGSVSPRKLRVEEAFEMMIDRISTGRELPTKRILDDQEDTEQPLELSQVYSLSDFQVLNPVRNLRRISGAQAILGIMGIRTS